MNVTYLGLVAGALTSAAAVPQVVRTYRTKQARDLSIWQPILLNIGMALWLIYGCIIGDTPLIAANSFSIFCYSSLIVMKVAYGEGKVAGPDLSPAAVSMGRIETAGNQQK